MMPRLLSLRRNDGLARPAIALTALILSLAAPASAQQQRNTANVVLITLDGLRWQELFSGADSVLLRDRRVVRDTAPIRAQFWRPTARERRTVLMPFFWSTIATQGQLYGNRALDSRVDVTNTHRFSYPGYNEILLGYADPRIDSNDKVPNPNRTLLEFANQQPGLQGKVAAFGSWDVFPFIINEQRSGVPVNAGFEPAAGPDLSATEVFLNRLQTQVPSPWSAVRLDAFTHDYALEYLKRKRPRLLYIAYGETDDFAHDQHFDFYLQAAQRTDGFIRELWEWLQSDGEYRNRTTLVITTDHGRGTGAKWNTHGADVDGAEQIWIAVLGPDSPALGEVSGGQLYQNQIAATVASLLGLRYTNERPVGAALPRLFTR
ncbi:MAG: alkaline phosphatase family protein [Gemmatimonadota bacterium]